MSANSELERVSRVARASGLTLPPIQASTAELIEAGLKSPPPVYFRIDSSDSGAADAEVRGIPDIRVNWIVN